MSSSSRLSSSTSLNRSEVEAAFAACDAESPDLLKISNLKLVMRSLGFEPRNAEIEALKKKIKESKKNLVCGDADSIDVDEFIALLSDKDEDVVEDKAQAEMKVAFGLFDKESKGYITLENLRAVAKELGEDVGEDELREMLQEAAKGGNGRVSEQEFYEIMKKTCLY